MLRKKWLVLLTALAILPAGTQAYAKAYAGYPFTYEDFEDKSTDSVTFANAEYNIYEPGYANSAAALKVKMTGNSQVVTFPIDFRAGETYVLSCRIKPLVDTVATNVGFYMYFNEKLEDGTAGKSEGYNSAVVSGLKLEKDRWTQVKTRFTFDGKAWIVGAGKQMEVVGNGRVEIRFANGSLENITGGHDFEYLLDDLCIEPEFKLSDIPDKSNEPEDFGGLVEGGSFEGKKLSDAWEQEEISAVLTDGGAEDTNQAVRIIGSGALKQRVPLMYSHTYSFKCNIKGSEQSNGKTAYLTVERNGTKEEFVLGVVSAQWQRFELSYYNPRMTDDRSEPYIYVTVRDAQDYFLDEISLTSEKGVIHDGSFSGDIETYWTAYNADVQITDDVPSGECSAEKSMHITQSARNGHVYQYVYMEPKTKYKLSFWAKGSSASGLKIKPRIETTDGASAVTFDITDDSLVFADEWTYYEVEFTTDAECKYLPKFYFLTSSSLKKTDFYLTDIKIEEITGSGGNVIPDEDQVYNTPEIRNADFDGIPVEGRDISIFAEYLGKNQQTGLVQVFKQADDGGWASVMMSEFGTEPAVYKVKAADAGQKLKFRIVPMDHTGAVGGYREKEIGTAVRIVEASSAFTTGLDAVVKAYADATNYSDKQKNIVAMLMLYDKDNTCIASTYSSGTTYMGMPLRLNVSAENDGRAKKAKLFLWEGTSDIQTSMTAIIKAIEINQ